MNAHALVPLALASLLTAQADQLCGEPVPEALLTTPERTGWQKTSTSKDVGAFLARVLERHPGTFELSTIGHTLQGRPIRVAKVQRPHTGGTMRLRALILANIHGGEIEGKEAVQVLLREVALGQHADILAACDLWFVPIFNVDGNDEIDPGNRVSQNGPTGVGKRSNSQDFDLNRDFVKVESPEARAALRLLEEVDPHLFMDLHTTNGSPHGYHLTYSPSLATNLDPDLDALMHERFIPAVRGAMEKGHGFRIFDYGNFNRSRDSKPSSWTTYDHKPRLVFNYAGLRNRLSLLSEAYSYLPFKRRAAVTRAFVLESVREMIRRRDEVLKLCAQADARAATGQWQFGYASDLRPAVRGKVLVGRLDRQPAPGGRGNRFIATDEYEPVEMDVFVRFAAGKHVALPAAWAVAGASEDVRRALLIHGVKVERLDKPAEVAAEAFEVASMRRPRVEFQGHRLVTLRGRLVAGTHRLPAGTLIVRSRQRLSRIAAQLLEGHSEDSLCSWEFFAGRLKAAGDKKPDELGYPVLRLTGTPALETTPLALDAGDVAVRGPYRPAPARLPADAITLSMACAKVGRRISGGGFESRVEWRDREVVWTLGSERLTDLGAVEAGLKSRMAAGKAPVVLQPDALITNDELVRTAEMSLGAGVPVVYLKRQPE